MFHEVTPVTRNARSPISARVITQSSGSIETKTLWVLSLATLILCCVTGCGSIEEPVIGTAWTPRDAERPLSHEDCVRLALESAPTAAAWQARLLGAQANLRQSKTLPNPTFSATWEDFALPFGATPDPLSQTFSLAVALEQLLSRPRLIAAAQFDRDAGEAELRSERALLAADVSRAYDDLVLARERILRTAESRDLARAQREATEKFVLSGLRPRIDIDRAGAEEATAELALEEARSDARAQELALAFSLGFERPTTLALSEPTTGPTDKESEALGQLLLDAAESRPEITAATARYAAERERLLLQAERVQFLPTLGAGPRFSSPNNTRGVASLDVVLPIFDSGETLQDAQSATLLAAAAALRKSTATVAREVCVAHGRLVDAKEITLVRARDLALRRRTLRLATERLFAAGEADFDTLMLTRRDEAAAQLALLDAESTVSRARLDLLAALGHFSSVTASR